MKVNLVDLKEKDPAAYGLTRASLIQKLIRRSHLAEALWVTKLFIDDGHSKGLRRRLLQIAAEDVGLACPKAIEYISQEEDLYKCTALLCLSAKNREVDRFLLSVSYNPEKYESADKQTKKEVQVLQHLDNLSSQWFSNKRVKASLTAFFEAVEYLSTFSPEYKETINLAGQIYIDLSRANVHGARVMLALIALLATRKVNNPPMPELSNLPPMKELSEVPDYALDMHTPAGRMQNRGFKHWVKEGAVVEPEYLYDDLLDSQGIEKYPLLPLIPFLEKLKN